MNIQAFSGCDPYQAKDQILRRYEEHATPKDSERISGRAGEEEPRTREPEYDTYIPENGKKAEKEKTQKSESCTGNTDKVDREIEKLKQKKAKLEQQIQTATDPGKKETLEKQLAQVERELAQKDNDAYRRAHTSFS